MEKHNQIQEKRAAYFKIIEKWLTDRDDGKIPNWHVRDEELKVPKYVADMCRDINSHMGNNKLDQIMSKETCASGHSDYSSKFALYCAELDLDISFKYR